MNYLYGVTLAFAFVLGFVIALRVRLMSIREDLRELGKARDAVRSFEETERVLKLREAETAEILSKLDAPETDDSPLGDVPPLPGDAKRNKRRFAWMR